MAEENKIEVGRWWRVLLNSANPCTYLDVWGVKPLVDDRGMLAFGNVADYLMGLFAPGTWVAVTPVRAGEPPEAE